MEFKNILVPVDGSEPSKRALQKAAYLAKVCQAKVTLLYVVDLNTQVSAFEQVSTGGFVTSDLKDEGYQVLTEMIRLVPQDITVRPLVEIGSPMEVIVEVAERDSAELIIMGSRGLGTIKQLVMGSVSQAVLHHSKCPVMTVH